MVTVSQNEFGMLANHASDRVFGVTAGDITRDLLAQIGSAVSSAGRFGSVGLSVANTRRGFEVISAVEVSSDEFANLTGFPQRATVHFVIDGGALFIDAGRDVQVLYNLSLTMFNLGNAPIETDESRFQFFPIHAPGFPFPDAEFATAGVLEADSAGNLTFQASGQDIGAVFDPMTGLVRIPLSFQSLDLGIVNPGDRLYLDYHLSLVSAIGLVAEGTFARFSDPFNLSANSVLGTIQLQPVGQIPEPSTLALVAAGIIGGIACRRRRRGRRKER